MLQYIFQVVLFQLLFLLIYDAFLKRETFFNYNRLYLLLTSVLSLVLPFVQIELFKSSIPENFIIRLPEVVIGNLTETSTLATQNVNTTAAVTETTLWSWWVFVYIGMLVAAFILAFKLIKIYWLLHKNPSRWHGDILLVQLLNSKAAFSFFHYVFLGEKISTTERQSIIKHELVHVQQKHSLDLLYFEVLRVLFWFNPLIYMYQNRLIALHEYLADAEAVKHQDKNGYYQNLLAQVFDTTQISFINPFYKQSLIKKRIVMLSKSKSKQLQLLKYALLIPMVVSMLMYTSSYAQDVKKTSVSENTENMTDDELIDKLYLDIVNRMNESDDFVSIWNYVKNKDEKYISSREDYYKLFVFMKVLSEKAKEIRKEKKILDPNNSDFLNIEDEGETKTFKQKSYQEYLVSKQTDEVKKHYENNVSNKSFRMVVNDVNFLSELENIRKNEYLNLIKKDYNFDTLILADMNGEVLFLQTNRSSNSSIGAGSYSGSTNSDNYDEIPFAVVERVPAFEGCEGLPTNQQTKACTSAEITKFVNKNFDTSIATKAGLKGRQRINVVFKIDTNGNLVEVRARAPHPDLETEAKRVVEQIPQMTPGKHKGKNITVQYSLPIIFQISE